MTYRYRKTSNRLTTWPTAAGEIHLTDSSIQQAITGGLAILAASLTADRTYTLPDATVTLAALQLAQEWTAVQTMPGLQFDLTPSVTPAEGLLWWNETDGTLNLGMPGGNVYNQIGQEMFLPRRVKNTSGTDMTNGQLVYISGGDGANVYISLAKADAEATSAFTIAMLTEDIDDGHYGYATLVGLVRDVNTAGYAPGTPLYLSATTAGAYTDTRPAAPNHGVFIGTVFRQHASEGSIIVSIDNGYELSELHDVTVTAPAAGNILAHNGTIWVNSTSAAAGIWAHEIAQDDNGALLLDDDGVNLLYVYVEV